MEQNINWTKTIAVIAGIIGVIAFFFGVVSPMLKEKNERDRVEGEYNSCIRTRVSSVVGSLGECVIDVGDDGLTHVYWREKRY